ncbi:MAG: amidohydrolase family protein, partial [bacterium]
MSRSAAPPSRTDDRSIWSAALVCPVASPPVREGGILVNGDRIEAVGPADELRAAAPGAPERAFGRAVLIPGMVNAHTHLELSGLGRFGEGGPPEGGMAGWIGRLVRELREWPPHLFLASARLGAAASLASGVTCAGDITVSGQSLPAMGDAGLRGVAFHEAFGLEEERAEEILAERIPAEGEIPDMAGGLAGGLRQGVSPHAPYSTSPRLYRLLLDLAGARGWPAAGHLAESPEEVQFLLDGGGPLAEMHRALGSRAESFTPPGFYPLSHLYEIYLI